MKKVPHGFPDWNTSFEVMAHYFYTATGNLAPGKSYPAIVGSPDEEESKQIQHDWTVFQRGLDAGYRIAKRQDK